MTKHVLSTVVEIHVSYPIFVDKEQFAKHLLTDPFADAQKDGVDYQQHSAFNMNARWIEIVHFPKHACLMNALILA
jgi:hypothetical protein